MSFSWILANKCPKNNIRRPNNALARACTKLHCWAVRRGGSVEGGKKTLTMITLELSAGTAAVASAIAASASALTAILMFVIQRRSFVEATRPELVVDGWKRTTEGEGDRARDIVSFHEVRNVGNGPAVGVHMNVYHSDTARPKASMETSRIPILGPGDSDDRGWSITLHWRDDDRPLIQFDVSMICWDTRNRKYDTVYPVFASQLDRPNAFYNEVAPGVSVPLRRRPQRVPIWHIKLKRSLLKKHYLPGFLGRHKKRGRT